MMNKDDAFSRRTSISRKTETTSINMEIKGTIIPSVVAYSRNQPHAIAIIDSV
jgi:hypothetical protein